MIRQLSALQLAQRLQQDNPPMLIDVREPHEYDIARIPGTRLHVLKDIGTWSKSLDRAQAYVLVCHHGGRSHTACQLLQHMGFTDVTNLDGGTDGWAASVDPTMARY